MKKRYYIIPLAICLILGISLVTVYVKTKMYLHDEAVDDAMIEYRGVEVLDRGTIKLSGINYENYTSIFLMFEVNDLKIFCADEFCRTLSEYRIGVNLISLSFYDGISFNEEMIEVTEPILWEDTEITRSINNRMLNE